jgi:hypothetical protein
MNSNFNKLQKEVGKLRKAAEAATQPIESEDSDDGKPAAQMAAGTQFGKDAVPHTTGNATTPNPRHIWATGTTNIQKSHHHHNRSELDSHANTCCAGANTAVLYYTGNSANVQPFSDAYKSTSNIPIASVGTAYDCRHFILARR